VERLDLAFIQEQMSLDRVIKSRRHSERVYSAAARGRVGNGNRVRKRKPDASP